MKVYEGPTRSPYLLFVLRKGGYLPSVRQILAITGLKYLENESESKKNRKLKAPPPLFSLFRSVPDTSY